MVCHSLKRTQADPLYLSETSLSATYMPLVQPTKHHPDLDLNPGRCSRQPFRPSRHCGSESALAHRATVDPSAGFFQKIWLAEPYFRLISGLAEFLWKLRNSAENTSEHHKFGLQDRQIETIKFKI